MALNEEIIQKRLKQVRIAQESVEAISSWVLHHVKYVSTISRVWFDVYLTANDELRISLIYVMNDVCQKSRKSPKEQFIKITSSFFHHLRYAIQLSNDKVKEKIRRVIGILKERQIFSPHKVDELNKILSGELTREFPTDRSFNENIGKQLVDEGKQVKAEYDKYFLAVQKYLDEEDIYHVVRKREHENDVSGGIKKAKLSPRTSDEFKEIKQVLETVVKKVSIEVDSKSSVSAGINVDAFLKPVKDTKDGLERAEQIINLTQKLQQSAATEIAKNEGKEGVLNRKTLALENVTQPGSLKDLPEIDGTKYDSWKHIRSERIKQLKKKVTSEIKNGDSEKYSPTKTGHETLMKPLDSNTVSPAKKSLSFNESEEANQFLNSIPLPKDTTTPSLPPPPQISPTRIMMQPPMSMNYDVAPPGVDLPPPLQIPSSQAYDPTAMYSPTDPSGYYPNTGMMFPSSHSQMMSPPPRFYTPISPTLPPSNVYNNNFIQQRPMLPPRPPNQAYYDPNFYNH